MTSFRRDGPRRRERGLRAPAWLEELVRTSRPPVPWRDVVRFAVAIPAPLAVAVARRGRRRAGTGAGRRRLRAPWAPWPPRLAPQSGPLRDRLRRTAAAVGVRRRRAGRRAVRHAAAAGRRSLLIAARVRGRGADQLDQRGACPSARCSCWSTPRSPPGWSPRCPLAGRGRLLPRRRRVGDPRHPRAGPHRGRSTPTAPPSPRCSAASPTCSRPAAPTRPRTPAGALDHRAQRRLRPRDPQPQPLRRPHAASSPSWPACSTPPRPLVEGAVAAARGRRARPTPTTSPPSARWPPRSSGDRGAARRAPAAAGGRAPPPGGRCGTASGWCGTSSATPRSAPGRPPSAAEVDLRTRLRDLADRTLASPDSRAFAVRLTLCMTIAEVARQLLPDRAPLLGAADRGDRAQARLRLGVHPRRAARRRHAARRPDRLGAARASLPPQTPGCWSPMAAFAAAAAVGAQRPTSACSRSSRRR